MRVGILKKRLKVKKKIFNKECNNVINIILFFSDGWYLEPFFAVFMYNHREIKFFWKEKNKKISRF